MDCSNPVAVNERMTLGEARIAASAYVRQDLTALKNAAARVERVRLPEPAPRPRETVEADLAAIKRYLPKVPDPQDGAKKLIDLTDFLDLEAEAYPVCGYVGLHGPVHTPAVKMSKGKVHVTRTFGGSTSDDVVLEAALRHFSFNEVREAVEENVYTQGTPDGFLNRLKMAMSRPAVSSLRTAGVKTHKQLAAYMAKLLPIDPAYQFPDWNRDLDVVLDDVEITRTSNAGFPYCRSKKDATDDCLQVVIPNIIEHVSKYGWQDLMEKQPELFLVEVKNKQDVYKVKDLKTKCRPYMSYPMHFTIFWSYLSQAYNDAMYIVGGSKTTSNACGWSMAKNGGKQKIEYVKRHLKKSGDWFIEAYSDDVVVYYNDAGKIMRISPDFVQMDSSIDKDIVVARVHNIVEAFKQQHGPNQWFESLAQLWIDMALDPSMIIHGTRIWRKKSAHGMCSGVPDTTGINTYKSVLAYHKMLEAHDIRTLTQEQAFKWMRTNAGLEIKKGTWHPEEAFFDAPTGLPQCDQTFLGVYWMNREDFVVPYLPTEKWLSMLLTPKDKKLFNQYTVQAMRRRFDRARGYMVTGAVYDERIRNVLHSIVNDLPPEVIIMEVQANAGKGESPQEGLIIPGYEFPSSDVMPTISNVDAIYSGREREPWVSLFPGVKEFISGLMPLDTRGFKQLKPYTARVNAGQSVREEVVNVLVPQPPTKEPLYVDNPGISGQPYTHKRGSKIPVRSPIITKDGQRLMTSHTIEEVVDDLILNTPMPMPVLADRLGMDLPHTRIAVANAGYDPREEIAGTCTAEHGPVIGPSVRVPQRKKQYGLPTGSGVKNFIETVHEPLKGIRIKTIHNGVVTPPPNPPRVTHNQSVTSSAQVGEPIGYVTGLLLRATGQGATWSVTSDAHKVDGATPITFTAVMNQAGYTSRARASTVKLAKKEAAAALLDHILVNDGVPIASGKIPLTPEDILERANNARNEAKAGLRNEQDRTLIDNENALVHHQELLARVDARMGDKSVQRVDDVVLSDIRELKEQMSQLQTALAKLLVQKEDEERKASHKPLREINREKQVSIKDRRFNKRVKHAPKEEDEDSRDYDYSEPSTSKGFWKKKKQKK